MEALTAMGLENIAILTLVVVLVLDRVIGMLKTRGIDLVKMATQINTLYEWHDREDVETGVKVWYVQHSLEKAIDNLAESIKLEIKLLEKIDRRLERLEDKLIPTVKRRPDDTLR